MKFLKEIDDYFMRLYERRYELIVIVVTSVLIASLLNLIMALINPYLANILSSLNATGVIVISALCMVALIVSILILGTLYYSRPIVYSVPMRILINLNKGIVYPYVEPTFTAMEIITRTASKIGKQYFRKKMMQETELMLRDLAEMLLVDWLIRTQVFYMEIISRVKKAPVKFPKIGCETKEVNIRDVLEKFGDNIFMKSMKSIAPITKFTIPKPLNIIVKRYGSEITEPELGKQPPYITTISSIAGISELRIEGSRFTPLQQFRVIMYISEIATAGNLALMLFEGCKPVEYRSNEIICINHNGKTVSIQGEKLEDLKAWIEVVYEVMLIIKMRAWLFLHPKFNEILTWAKSMTLRAIDYFTSTTKILTTY